MTIKTLHDAPTDDELHAYVDGRLDPARRAAVAAWLEAHPEQAAQVEGWKRDAERLRALAANPEHWVSNAALTPAQVRRGLQARRRRRMGIASEGSPGWAMNAAGAKALPMRALIAALLATTALPAGASPVAAGSAIPPGLLSGTPGGFSLGGLLALPLLSLLFLALTRRLKLVPWA